MLIGLFEGINLATNFFKSIFYADSENVYNIVRKCVTLSGTEHFREVCHISKYGHKSHYIVTLTFFVWEITSKFFFLAWGIWVLEIQ